jgi:hypothetical protein
LKVRLSELKKALSWIEANTNVEYITANTDEREMTLKSFDKSDSEIIITIFSDGTMLPKIRKTEVLK